MSRVLLKALRSDSYVELSQYRDQHFRGDNEEQKKLLEKNCTLYVGNLSFYTTEEQIYELFSKSGDIKKIIMGVDKMKKTASGFCFVEYYSRADAENAMRYINGTRLDDRIIHTGWDAGFKEGRQYGRGRSGGQVRDEYRQDYDAGRGGYGKLAQKPVSGESPIKTNSLLAAEFHIHHPRSATCFFYQALRARSPLHGFLLKIIKRQNSKECL